ncbi:hypothetical protein BLA29_000677 [Euroglyphus maynei]|uniref:Uncharacterized protein n=1 Tax=Euroglyphus maynei TaxID=6958 RepID=A0A1Y3B1Q2_EURMA|nr:hypothetical protein BLA29_000677 [Euroglyphus maynei]
MVNINPDNLWANGPKQIGPSILNNADIQLIHAQCDHDRPNSLRCTFKNGINDANAVFMK